jgi:hypothetical protein
MKTRKFVCVVLLVIIMTLSVASVAEAATPSWYKPPISGAITQMIQRCDVYAPFAAVQLRSMYSTYFGIVIP